MGKCQFTHHPLTQDYSPAHISIDPAASVPDFRSRFNTLIHALAFVLGFSIVFILGWGGTVTIFGQVFTEYKKTIGQVGGLAVIGFGLMTLGVLKISWLNMDSRPQWKASRPYNMISSGLMGVFFAAGWTPCIGTTLGAILTLSFSQEGSRQAMVLSSGYALGLGIPFLLIGFGMNHALRLIRRLRHYQRAIQIASGLLLIIIGLMLFSNRLSMIAIWAQKNGYFFDLRLGSASVPSYLIAVVAGLVSFLSPCVLPLVPAYVGYLSGQSISSAK